MQRTIHLKGVGIMACLLLLILPAGALAATAGASVTLTSTKLSPGETLLLGALGHAFNLDTDVILQYRSDLGTTEGAVTVSYTSGLIGASGDEILRARKDGKQWDEITRASLPPGLQKKPANHPGRANHEAKARQGIDPYEFDTTVRFLAEYYRVDAEWIIGWLDVGITIEDIALSLNLSARVHINPDDVVRLRYNSREWEWRWIASRYGISLKLLEEPVPPKGSFPKPGRGSLR